MRVLEEDLGPAQLVVRLAQHLLADLVARLATVHLVRRGTAVDKVPEYVLLNLMLDMYYFIYNLSRRSIKQSCQRNFAKVFKIFRGKPYYGLVLNAY